MLQLSLTQFVTISVITFTWTITSLCACRIIDDLIENIKKIKQELSELKENYKINEHKRLAELAELAENRKVLAVLEKDYKINEPKRLAEVKKAEQLRIYLLGN